jgi:hypothetical protein
LVAVAAAVAGAMAQQLAVLAVLAVTLLLAH